MFTPVVALFSLADQTSVEKELPSHMAVGFGSVDRLEVSIFHVVPPSDFVVRRLGYFLDAPQSDGLERNLAVILEFFEGGSLESFLRKNGSFCVRRFVTTLIRRQF